MTSEPPASSDGASLPSRHRPTLGNLAQDTTERDLWDFEDDLEHPDEEAKPEVSETPRSSGRDIPLPRESQPVKPREAESRPASKAAGGEERVRMNVNKSGPKNRPSGPASAPARPESEFDELEQWENVNLEPEIGELPVEAVPELIVPKPEPKPAREGKPDELPAPESSAKVPAKGAEDDEFSVVPCADAKPVSLRPHLRFSKVERIGLIVLIVVLLGGAATVFISSLKLLPVESTKAESNDFPITGDRVSIISATSYWRPPVREGPDADTFRRGTELLPVVELAVSGGPAALRILFRSDDKTVVGDAVTRMVSAKELLKIPATAGFDDPGMHAAYRTGESKPWTIEVYEAPSEDASGKDFKKLFEMNISTDRR